MSKYLMPEHPSFDCRQAWFLFAVKNHRGTGFCRLILVEAKSHAAVAFLERVSTSDGGEAAVSPTVAMMAVHRQCPVVGIRSGSVEEVDFKTFANDIVDRSRVERDPLAVEAYREAMSAPSPRALPEAAAPAAEGSHHKDVCAVLKSLGFEGLIASVVPSLGDIESRPLTEVVQQAVDACRSASAE